MLRFKRIVWVGLALVALALSACGDDEGNGSAQSGGTTAESSGVAEAKQIVTEREAPITKGPSVPAFDASSLKGKNVWFVSLALSIPYSQQVWSGVQQGAAALGMKATSFDGKFSPADVTRGIDLAVQDKADAIIVHSLPAGVVAPAIAEAKEAGVKIISAETQNPGPPLPDVPDTVDALAGHSYSIPAEAMAAQIVADSGGKAKVHFYSASDIGPGSKQGTDAFVAKLKELCADCEVEVEDAPVAQWSGMTQRVTSLLRSQPDLDYIVPIFDGMSVGMLPGIRSSGSDVKIVTGDATDSVLQALADGEFVLADIGQPNVWTGVGILDQTARVLAGEPPVEDIGVQYRMFTSNNISSIDLKAEPSTWYGDVDFLAEYKKIWGVG